MVNRHWTLQRCSDNGLGCVLPGSPSKGGLSRPDLIGFNGNPASGFYLVYYPSGAVSASYPFAVQLTTSDQLATPTPTGGNDWRSRCGWWSPRNSCLPVGCSRRPAQIRRTVAG